ncbi:MAG: DUF1800 domain-containing protein [Lysobacterales bacterium]
MMNLNASVIRSGQRSRSAALNPARIDAIAQRSNVGHHLAQWQKSRTGAGRQKKTSASLKGADRSVVHLLNRTSFGIAGPDLNLARELGFEGYLNYQLDAQQIDDQFLEDLLADLFPALNLSYQEIFDRLGEEDFDPASELIVATIARQLFSPRQLFEVMTEFWSNHFNVFLLDGAVEYLKIVDDRVNVRPFALGQFSQLLSANARSPAMLYYLDNFSNTRFGPNENYARELMELHTLGVDGGYTENDVVEVARCFTGWTIDPRSEEVFAFSQEDHDVGAKTVLGVDIPAGGGIEDGEQVLNLLLSDPATPQFLARKLCRRFISDQPSESIVNSVAQSFESSGGDVPSVMRAVLLSDEFMASENQKFRRPNELVGSMVRSLQPVDGSNYFSVIFRQLETLGQIPFFAPDPTGYPDQQGDWLNTNALLSRWNLGFSVAFGEIPASTRVDANDIPDGQRVPVMADFFAINVLELIADARTPAQIVDRVLEEFLHRQIGVADRSTLITLASGNGPATAPLSLSAAVASARAVLASALASRYFQNR